jgi:hypothetical protein
MAGFFMAIAEYRPDPCMPAIEKRAAKKAKNSEHSTLDQE